MTVSMASAALSAAQLKASIDRADEGGANASLRFYSTSVPLEPGAVTDAPLAVVELAKPCAKVVGGFMVWAFASGGMVMTPGIPRWAEWVAADGAQLHIGDVTDMDGDGFYRVQGGSTPDGDNSPLFYAGSLIVPGVSQIT